MVDYAIEKNIQGCYWSINPESADTGGLYGTTYVPGSNESGWGTWTEIDNRRMELLKRLWDGLELAPEPTPEPTPTPTPPPDYEPNTMGLYRLFYGRKHCFRVSQRWWSKNVGALRHGRRCGTELDQHKLGGLE